MQLLFLGDFCCHGDVIPELSPSANELFKQSDLICLNFEGAVFSSGMKPLPKAGPSIGQSLVAFDLCREWGITHLAMANNHIMDYGEDGLTETFSHSRGLSTFGAGSSFTQAYQPCLVEFNNHLVALLAFSEAQFGVLQHPNLAGAGYAWIDHPQARKAVRDACIKADFVIVQVHGGLEMFDAPLPEWRQRYRELIDLGADLVVGHHSHVIQGSECYEGKMIHYSLGNFYMDMMLRQADPGSGCALKVTISESGMDSEVIPLQVSLPEICLDRSQQGRENYQKLCEKLKDEFSYLNEVDKVCEIFWEEIYSDYYESALTGLGTTPRLKRICRVFLSVLRRMIKRPAKNHANELLLIHNICIETHRWVVERALKNRVNK